MKVNDIFRQKRKQLDSYKYIRIKELQENSRECPKCGKAISYVDLKKYHYVCPECQNYLPMPPRERLAMIGDMDTFHELFGGWKSKNPLEFPDYERKLEAYQKKYKEEEAILTGVIKINGQLAAIGVMDSRFLMGSMGTVVGEKISCLAEYAGKKKLPLILFSASGGARMQEGLFSLMQMAKTSAAIEKFKDGGGLYISCLTNPTTGGVSASFANLGDIILAEPDALICFAGPRVIEQTIGQTLPEGFQRSEFLLDHGMLDLVVDRDHLKDTMGRLLAMHQKTRG